MIDRSRSDFLLALQDSPVASANRITVQPDGSVSFRQFGPAEFSLLTTELHEAGFSFVSSRIDGNSQILGVMSSRELLPSFFEIEIRSSSFRIPSTKGFFLAFLGPDGVGKTTAVDRVMKRLTPIFAEQHLFHWRPQLIKPRTKADELNGDSGWLSINRHGDPPRSAFISMLRLGGVYVDYVRGQRVLISPALKRGALIVFDRYFHDILVDSRRYRYGGPRWLLSLMKHLLPQRKAFLVVLDADERVILARKQEVAPEELRHQRREYARLADDLHALHVRTDYGIEHTVSEVLKGIGQHLMHNFDERLQQAYLLPSSVQAGPAQEAVGRVA